MRYVILAAVVVVVLLSCCHVVTYDPGGDPTTAAIRKVYRAIALVHDDLRPNSHLLERQEEAVILLEEAQADLDRLPSSLVTARIEDSITQIYAALDDWSTSTTDERVCGRRLIRQLDQAQATLRRALDLYERLSPYGVSTSATVSPELAVFSTTPTRF